MNLASISENINFEKRIAITPEIAKKYISLGFNLSLPNDYGVHLGFKDNEYKDLGVNIVDDLDAAISAALQVAGDTDLAVIPEGPYVVPVSMSLC